jgi:putative methylase
VRRAELIARLERIPPFARPQAELEQVVTPSEAAATLLLEAEQIDGVGGRSVLDLGCGTGRLAIGAALLGAAPVVGVDVDPGAVQLARRAAAREGLDATFETSDVRKVTRPADLVVMNPPFGAQRRHADRPFWERALTLAGRSVYAFALGDSRTFIARQTVAAGAHVLDVTPVPWVLPRTFAHHRRKGVALSVDLWAIRTSETK